MNPIQPGRVCYFITRKRRNGLNWRCGSGTSKCKEGSGGDSCGEMHIEIRYVFFCLFVIGIVDNYNFKRKGQKEIEKRKMESVMVMREDKRRWVSNSAFYETFYLYHSRFLSQFVEHDELHSHSQDTGIFLHH